ncbi:MAG: hypothetical protein MJY97_01205 [Bacteroidales bacterium]|nr:hypothetical protein [Bacteroidales bacterium]
MAKYNANPIISLGAELASFVANQDTQESPRATNQSSEGRPRRGRPPKVTMVKKSDGSPITSSSPKVYLTKSQMSLLKRLHATIILQGGSDQTFGDIVFRGLLMLAHKVTPDLYEEYQSSE